MRGNRNDASVALLQNLLQERLRSEGLSAREVEIGHWVLQGLSNKEVAARCFITEQTVKDHLKHIYQKLGIHQRSRLFARLLGNF